MADVKVDKGMFFNMSAKNEDGSYGAYKMGYRDPDTHIIVFDEVEEDDRIAKADEADEQAQAEAEKAQAEAEANEPEKVVVEDQDAGDSEDSEE